MDWRKGLSISVVVILVAVVIVSELAFDTGSQNALEVYSADAYVPEVSAMLHAFREKTGIGYEPVVSGGSFYMARKIAMGAPASLFFSVSLKAYGTGFLNDRSDGWALAIASDQMVIAYSNSTMSHPYAVNLVREFKNASASNSSAMMASAFAGLCSGEVKVGISNPAIDPAGVRGWLLLEIAGYLYHNGDENYYTTMIRENGGNITGANAAELVSPLVLGHVDFLFIYRSAALSHNLSFITLPPVLNQGDPLLASFYERFNVSFGGSSVAGTPILLFVSTIRNGSHLREASEFISFVMNSTSILERFGLTVPSKLLLFGNPGDHEFLLWGLLSGKIKVASDAL